MGSGCLGGLWETSSHAPRCRRCWCSRCRTRLQVRGPLPPPAGRRPAAGRGTGWLACRCSLGPRGPPPSRTATHGPPVNQSTLCPVISTEFTGGFLSKISLIAVLYIFKLHQIKL